MKSYEYFRDEFMDIMRQLREGKLPLDNAISKFRELEINIAKQIAKGK